MTPAGGALLPALSIAPRHVAVNVPVSPALPPLVLTAALVATPERPSVVVQPAAGTEPAV